VSDHHTLTELRSYVDLMQILAKAACGWMDLTHRARANTLAHCGVTATVATPAYN